MGSPAGLIRRGNVDLADRPRVRNGNGISTVRSISVTLDNGLAVLIPTVVNGRIVSDQQAINHYRRTGQNLGTFVNERLANVYAEALHKQQAQMYPVPPARPPVTSEKFTRFDDGSIVFPNGGGWDPEERRVISPQEAANRQAAAAGGMAPHSQKLNAMIAALRNTQGDMMGPQPGPPPPNAMDFARNGYDYAHPITTFIQNALLRQRRRLPVQYFPPNSPLGRLQVAFGVSRPTPNRRVGR